MPLDAVEGFEIDYLKKNLRLKRKGGKNWNFESPTGSADPCSSSTATSKKPARSWHEAT